MKTQLKHKEIEWVGGGGVMNTRVSYTFYLLDSIDLVKYLYKFDI